MKEVRMVAVSVRYLGSEGDKKKTVENNETLL